MSGGNFSIKGKFKLTGLEYQKDETDKMIKMIKGNESMIDATNTSLKQNFN